MELSMRTCHPVTRMPVEIEIMVNADQTLFPIFPITALIVLDIMHHAHAYGSATHVELSIRTCHPVTRVTRMTVTKMTVETMVNADQGSLFPIIVKFV